jgi:hypothetical protein
METPTSESIETRLANLESRMTRVEKRLSESQMLVARKLMEFFTTLKKQQQLRDTQVQQTLTKLLEQIAALKAHLDPMVSPITTH